MPDDVSEWSAVKIVATVEEAELLTGFLRNEGIPCRVESTHSNEFPLNVGELASIKIEVPRNRSAEALRLLGDLDESEDSRAGREE